MMDDSNKRLCEKPNLLIMKFDSTGVGSPIRAGEYCNATDSNK
jgi:hypothetical protein